MKLDHTSRRNTDLLSTSLSLRICCLCTKKQQFYSWGFVESYKPVVMSKTKKKELEKNYRALMCAIFLICLILSNIYIYIFRTHMRFVGSVTSVTPWWNHRSWITLVLVTEMSSAVHSLVGISGMLH